MRFRAMLAIGLAGLAVFRAEADTAPAASQNPPRSFLVFFNHAEVDVPKSADAVLPQTAEAYRRVGYSSVAIECFSDNLRTAEHTQAITEQRATRLKATLILYGIPAGSITAKGLGTPPPLVPGTTGPVAVSNRRCTLTLS